ncbi:winged helix-turn-helix domain-containing protein [Agrobacterium sp. P15N1-A]|uniref:winged helix-turn-helix domain-containing protein n=1 Tax=Agrobacterium sp. P15N1-A TaxID=3342820 RepID=UPI0037D92C79
MRNVLLVQSNSSLGEILKASFQREGFSATLLESVSDIGHLTAKTFADLVVLDETSAASGINVCTDIRLATSAPILVLADAQAERRWAGVADDVLTAPFAVQDLLARSSILIGKVPLRRTVYSSGDISMNLETHRVTRGTRVIHLAPTEFRLLQLFLAEPQRLWSRAEIVDRVWSPGRDERIVDVAVKKLRAALNRRGGNDAIRTVRGAGYGMA